MLRVAAAAARRGGLARGLATSTKGAAAGKGAEAVSLIGADQSMGAQMIFHKTSLGLLALTPLALAAPAAAAMPFDIALSFAFPLHAHIGLNWIITDYMPWVGPSGALRYALAGLTAVTIAGLLKVSIADETGLTGTLKATWKEPEAPAKVERKPKH